MSSQAADPAGSLGLAMMDPVRATKFKEDLFTKSNLEYENRLKEHLYQFENRVGDPNIDDALHGDAGTMMQISQPKNYSRDDDSSPEKSHKTG